MTSDMKMTPGSEPEATETNHPDFTTDRSLIDPSLELLRYLLAGPARLVVEVCNDLVPHDFPDMRHVTIIRAMKAVAAEQIAAGEGSDPIPAVIVQARLQSAGELDHGRLGWELFAAAAGRDPVPDSWSWELVSVLKEARARSACTTAGEALLHAADGSDDDLLIAVKNLRYLPELLERAGLGGDADER